MKSSIESTFKVAGIEGKCSADHLLHAIRHDHIQDLLALLIRGFGVRSSFLPPSPRVGIRSGPNAYISPQTRLRNEPLQFWPDFPEKKMLELFLHEFVSVLATS